MFLSGMLAWGRTRVKTNALTPLLHWGRWLPPGAWMAGIFYLSHQAAPLGQTANAVEATGSHLVLYAGLGLLVYWALATTVCSRAAPTWVLAAISFAITVLYGASDELHQAFVSGRTASEVDLALDAAGAVLGVTLALLVSRLLANEGGGRGGSETRPYGRR